MDRILKEIAAYVAQDINFKEEAYTAAKLSLMDSLGCASLALSFPECTKLLGPFFPGTVVPNGSRVPGTDYVLDPVTAAFNIGMLIRWLDYNDTWLAKEWAHPSDNLGAILALGDYHQCRVKDVLNAMIKAYEIQGVLAISNSLNSLGFDHVFLVKIASAAVATKMMGGSLEKIENALSQALIDAGPLRTYRHAPNTGSRKSWAAGDATARGVFLAWLTMRGEMGYPQALTSPTWGVQDALLRGKELTLTRPLESYVIENILYKVSFPAEFHAQTAVEAAIQLHPQVKHKLNLIKHIKIDTHNAAKRIIDKKGPLNNPADRDHCLQYMVAIALIKGTLTAEDYEDIAAQDERIDKLREKMELIEHGPYSEDYLHPDKRSIANSLTIHFTDGTQTEKVTVEYPLGHKRRRKEAEVKLIEKARLNFESRYPKKRVATILESFKDKNFDQVPLRQFIDLLI